MAIDGAVSQTAVEAWDKRWATSEGRADWLEPHPAVVAILTELHARGARRVLDLGCGVGRHALLLAEHGFDVEAIDGSPAGLAVVRETAAARGLPVSLHQGLADALPFPDAGFDYVLAWNVIHHGTLGDPARRLGEIWRVLRPAGLLQATVLSTRDANYGIGRAIAPDTFVIDQVERKGHPHCYCDAATLVGLLAGFDLLTLSQQLQEAEYAETKARFLAMIAGAGEWATIHRELRDLNGLSLEELIGRGPASYPVYARLAQKEEEIFGVPAWKEQPHAEPVYFDAMI